MLVVVAVVVVGVAAGAVVTPFAVAVGPIIVVVLFFSCLDVLVASA